MLSRVVIRKLVEGPIEPILVVAKKRVSGSRGSDIMSILVKIRPNISIIASIMLPSTAFRHRCSILGPAYIAATSLATQHQELSNSGSHS